MPAMPDGSTGFGPHLVSNSVLRNKFGTLRVQFDAHVSEAIRALIENSYKKSQEICEGCGAAQIYLRMWIIHSLSLIVFKITNQYTDSLQIWWE